MKKSFFNRNTLQVAKDLLGCYLVNGKTIGKIVETEAYLCDDPACHASKGMTKRNEQMFSHPGTAYIYFIYGMYHCFNVVTREKGIGEAVLIRALEPIKGIASMKKRRNKIKEKDLCSGPAKLVIAMGIKKSQNGHDLTKGKLIILARKKKEKFVTTKRIGIKEGAHLPYRFYIEDNKFISRK